MLSDAPFTSPWSSEVFITGNYKLPLDEGSDEEDVILNPYKSTTYDNQPQMDSVSGSSVMTAGSDCSLDDLYIDGNDDGFLLDVEIDSCVQGLDSNLNDLIDLSVLGSVTWSDDEDDWSSNSSVSSATSRSPSKDWCPLDAPEASQAYTCSTIKPSSKYQSSRLKTLPCKKWSHLTKSQKAKLVDELSLTISSELGLREQMQIIKIINPSATFSKQSSEFVIDLNAIDDVKLEKIQDIVNFNCVQSSDVTRDHHSHNANRKFSKRNKSQDRKPKVEKLRVQKEYRQKLKERRSGLFVKEERLAVSESIMEEEIDILG